jgi:hypothetical protein
MQLKTEGSLRTISLSHCASFLFLFPWSGKVVVWEDVIRFLLVCPPHHTATHCHITQHFLHYQTWVLGNYQNFLGQTQMPVGKWTQIPIGLPSLSFELITAPCFSLIFSILYILSILSIFSIFSILSILSIPFMILLISCISWIIFFSRRYILVWKECPNLGWYWWHQFRPLNPHSLLRTVPVEKMLVSVEVKKNERK